MLSRLTRRRCEIVASRPPRPVITHSHRDRAPASTTDQPEQALLNGIGAALLLHGELNASIEVGRELVSADPCRETGHQLLMRGYAALQQPQLVIRQYRYCADVLHRELSVEPGAATRELLEHLTGG